MDSKNTTHWFQIQKIWSFERLGKITSLHIFVKICVDNPLNILGFFEILRSLKNRIWSVHTKTPVISGGENLAARFAAKSRHIRHLMSSNKISHGFWFENISRDLWSWDFGNENDIKIVLIIKIVYSSKISWKFFIILS